MLDSASLLFMSKFTELRAINLSDNQLASLPANLSMLDSIDELNVANNPLESIEQTTDALLSVGTSLVKLGINLHEENQVDYLLRTLGHLEVLNGIEVERDALFDETSSVQEDYLEAGNQSSSPSKRYCQVAESNGQSSKQ